MREDKENRGQMITVTPVLFSIPIVARRLNRSAKTIARLVREGALPSVLVGRRRMVHLDAILAAESQGIGGRKPRSRSAQPGGLLSAEASSGAREA